MAQHKWAKEIKHWANGGEIEYRDIGRDDWTIDDDPWWNDESMEFRIKPQPKEPQYLYVYRSAMYGFVFYSDTLGTEKDLIGKIKLEDTDGVS
jgi:hypothetical protein